MYLKAELAVDRSHSKWGGNCIAGCGMSGSLHLAQNSRAMRASWEVVGELKGIFGDRE